MTYNSGDVSVDGSFARFGTKSYAINKITSVDMSEKVVKKSGWLLWAIVAFFTGLIGVGAMADGSSTGATTMLAIAGFSVWRAVVGYGRRVNRTYFLMLATASGEVQATASSDPAEIVSMRQAIEGYMAAS